MSAQASEQLYKISCEPQFIWQIYIYPVKEDVHQYDFQEYHGRLLYNPQTILLGL